MYSGMYDAGATAPRQQWGRKGISIPQPAWHDGLAAFPRASAYHEPKGGPDFYRHFPNLRKEADGKYHIHHVNSNESVIGAHDTDEDLSAMRGIFAAAIRASALLGQDATLRAEWQEVLANLAPLPTSAHPEALRAADYTDAPV